VLYEYEINSVAVRTGDIICTHDGGAPILEGRHWHFVGNLIPGDVDHVALYLGPGGRCIEAGPKGVNLYEVKNKTWDSVNMRDQRGPVVDRFYGVACPVEGRGLAESRKAEIRENVARYCMAQAGKPYNMNFLNSKTEDTFYCSQLVCLAYLNSGINLLTELGVPLFPGTHSIIFPQEIWGGCMNKKA
jgi:uncharacterized protein YycO